MMTFKQYIILLFLTVILSNCKSSDGSSTVSSLADTIRQSLETADNKSITADNELKFASHTISFFLMHKQIPQVCKDVYNMQRPISDDSDVLALMDSIFTTNEETRPFYFLTVTKTMEKADGAYAEPLGIMGKRFVEERTKEFLNYFINEPLLTDADFDQWVQTVAGEIQISSEGHENEEALRLKAKMIKNCLGCKERQTQKLDEFTRLIKSHCP